MAAFQLWPKFIEPTNDNLENVIVLNDDDETMRFFVPPAAAQKKCGKSQLIFDGSPSRFKRNTGLDGGADGEVYKVTGTLKAFRPVPSKEPPS